MTVCLIYSAIVSLCCICTTIKITNEFKNVSVTVGVVDGLALHGKLLQPRLGASTGGVLVISNIFVKVAA